MAQIEKNTLQLHTSYRQIVSIALPIAAAIIVPQLNFITNNIFLGHVSEASLAAAGITGVYYLIFAVIGYGLNNGLQALISRRAGENRPEEIGKLFIQGVYISLAIAPGISMSFLNSILTGIILSLINYIVSAAVEVRGSKSGANNVN